MVVVVRREAVKVIGTVTVTSTGTVEEGSYFQTVGGTRFVALETVVVNSTADISVETVNAGASGNVAVGG